MKKINKSGFAHVEAVIVIIVIAAISSVGVYVYNANQDNNKTVKNSEVAPKIENLPEDLTGLLDISKLNEIVAAEASDQKMVDLELKNEDGTLVYEIKLTNGKVLVVNANTGAVVTTKDDDETDDEDVPNISNMATSFQEAVALAKTKHEGSIRKIETEVEDGVVVISVRFTDGYRVDINSNTGAIDKVKEAKKKSEKSEKTESKSEGSKSKSSSDSDDQDDEFEDDGHEDESQNDSSDEDDSDHDDDDDDDEDNDDNDEDEDDSNSGRGSDSDEDEI